VTASAESDNAPGGVRLPVPQRLVIVLPTTGEFDSRTWRIASAAAARGHVVTVLGRWSEGLSRDEIQPAGYRILRAPVSAIAGLPLPGPLRGALERRWTRRTVRLSDAAVGSSPAHRTVGVRRTASGGLLGRGQQMLRGAWRVSAIVLTVRSQIAAARRLDPGADIYHAMAYMGIPVGLAIAGRHGAPSIYDARDIYIDANNLARLPGPARWLLGRVERRWARRADRVVTVNRPYAEVMAKRWDVPLPAIVRNGAYRYSPPAIRPRRIHERLGLAPDRRVVLYHGGFSRHRGIEQLVAAIPSVPNATLVLLGYGDLAPELERQTATDELADRLRILPAVPPAELLDWVASADVVAVVIQPSTLNHRLTTPNKLLEAMAVGSPVVASDLPGMADIVRSTDSGLLVDPTDPSAIAAAIRSILERSPADAEAHRLGSIAATGERYSWEVQVEVLFREYGLLTGKPW
jgi:glycosyltransferase involved in cell wall biosynthesis